MSGVAGRYATALFELADSAGSLDQVADNLKSVMDMIGESEDFRRLIRSPLYSAENQAKAIGVLLKKAGIEGLTANFVGLVIKNRRLFALPDIIKAYQTLLSERKGIVIAEVTSAHALTDDQSKALQDTLNTALGKTIEVVTKTDPALLGGLVVKVGSRMVDSSLRTKLQSLKVAMKEAG